jgi:hypothetical protein
MLHIFWVTFILSRFSFGFLEVLWYVSLKKDLE